MKITNVKAFIAGKFEEVEVRFDETGILEIGKNLNDDNFIDGNGNYLYAGFIDCHNHGGWGIPFMKNPGTTDLQHKESIKELAKKYAKVGVTTVYPTLSFGDFDLIRDSVRNIREIRNEVEGVKFSAFQFEGIYPSLKRYVNPNCVNPTPEHTDDLLSNDYSDVKLFHISPDLPGSIEWCDYIVNKGVELAVGNTEASSNDVFEAVKHGLRHADHMFNGFKAIHHRENGAAVAVLLSDEIKAQLTCDGYHVAESWIRLLIKTKGIKNVYGTTDQSSSSGIEEGVHILKNGKKVIARDGQIFNEDGTISSGNLALDGVLRAAKEKCHLTMEEIGTIYGDNVADCLDIKDRGKIEVGRSSDFTIMDEDYNVIMTILDGKITYQK